MTTASVRTRRVRGARTGFTKTQRAPLRVKRRTWESASGCQCFQEQAAGGLAWALRGSQQDYCELERRSDVRLARWAQGGIRSSS